MDSTKSQNIISFCTGYGGIELGLRRISPNFRTVAYVEIEAFACTNLVAKIEEGKLDAAPIWTDIKTFDGEPFRGKVHGIIGGYPCQPFSNAGQRKGTDDPRHLWPYIEQHIRTIRPVWCFFENVSGHLTLGFKEVFTSLRDMGYAVEAGLFTAAEAGAPTRESDYSSYPTPATVDSGSYFNRSNSPGAALRPTSGAMAKYNLWLTPRECMPIETPENFRARMNSKRPNDRKDGLPNLAVQVNWPAPIESDYRSGEASQATSQKNSRPLRERVDGQPDPDKSNTPGKSRGQLNPAWVEQLMGLSLKWTNFGFWATGLSRKQQN